MNDFKKNAVKNSGTLDFVKKSLGDNKREYNEYFVYLIASYVDALSKVSLAFPADLNKVVSSFADKVENIAMVNPVTSETKVENKNLYLANYRKVEDIDIDFFSEFTNIAVASDVFKMDKVDEKNPLQNANNEYISQILYSVSNDPNVALQINEDYNNQKTTSYSNAFSNNPVMSSLLNLIAVSTGLSINYILSLSLQSDGEEKLKMEFDKVHGSGSFDNLMEVIKSLDVTKKNADGEKTSDIEVGKLLDSSNNIDIKSELSALEYEKVKQVEYVLVKNFFEKHDETFIKENYEQLEKSISSPEVKAQFTSEFEKARSNISIRQLENSHGFIGLKYVLGTVIFIILIIAIVFIFMK